MTNFQAIFQIKLDGVWLDYCREPFENADQARDALASVQLSHKEPMRVYVEHWKELGEVRQPTKYFGDWS